MTNINLARILFAVSLLLTLARPGHAALAASISLDPSQKTVQPGQSYETNVQVDLGTAQAFGADAIILYPQGDIEVLTVEPGGFFPDFSQAKSAGRIELHGYVSETFGSKSGSGTFAKIIMKSLSGNGDAHISFSCTGQSPQTYILDSNGNNILSCSNVYNQTVTFVTPSDTPSNTPTRTPTVTRSPTPQPTQPGSSASPTSTPSRTPTNPPAGGPTRTRTPTPTPTRSTALQATKTMTPTKTPTPNLSPTPQEVVFTLISPSPFPKPESAQKQKEADPMRLFLGLGTIGSAIIVGVYMIYKGKKEDNKPPQIYHG